MTQRDKELLERDLSCRIPYGVILNVNGISNVKLTSVSWYGEVGIDNGYTYLYTISEIKPYLFPLSSMTEEQKQYIKNRFCYDWDGEPYDLWKYQIEIGDTDELIDWLNKSHFDYRVLIEKGLAIDATGLNIY